MSQIHTACANGMFYLMHSDAAIGADFATADHTQLRRPMAEDILDYIMWVLHVSLHCERWTDAVQTYSITDSYSPTLCDAAIHKRRPTLEAHYG